MSLGEGFVGRRAELEELRSATDDAFKGRGSLVIVAGEPGIGKTRLAEVAADYAIASGFTVRWASCWEGPAASFWPWTQLVREQLAAPNASTPPPEVARLAGAVTDNDGPEGDAAPVRFALFDAVTRFFRSAASAAPLLFVIDDIHWADVPSLRLLEFFAQDVRDVPVLVVATFRDVEIDPATEAGQAIQRVIGKGRIVHVDGLQATEVAELLAASTGTLAETEFARTVHQRSGGNPLFVGELARLMRSQGRTGTQGSLRVPQGVQSVIVRRLARLSQRCNELLGVASVLGPQFGIAALQRTGDIDNHLALELLGEAETARLIVASEDTVGRYAFSHALVRDALYDAIPLPRRIAMHQRAGETLEALGNVDAHVDELAHHFVQAAPAGSVSKAIEYSIMAGRRAADQLAYESSAAHLQRAIDALDLVPDDDRRANLLLELGDAHLRAGNMPAARDAFEAAADLARRRGRTEDLARAALGFGAGLAGFEIQMYDAKQIELLEEAIAAIGEDDSTLRAWLAARLSVALSYQESIARRRELAEEAIGMARRIGERKALAYALAAHCDAIAGPDMTQTRLEHATEIIDIAREQRDRPMELLGRRLRIVALLETGEIHAADADIEAFARVADLIRQPLYLWYVSLWRGMRALLDGRVDDALSLANEAEAIGARAHSANSRMLASVLRCQSFFTVGRFEGAWEAINTLTEILPEAIHPYMWVSNAWLFGRAGRVGEADAALARLDPGVSWIGFDSEWLATMCQLSEAIDALGARGRAEEIYDKLLPYRTCVGVDGIGAALHGSMELHLGFLARTLGNLAGADEHFTAAIEANARLGAPLLVARAQRELKSVLTTRAEPGDAERAARLPEPADAGPTPAGTDDGNRFVREGEFWTLSFEAATVRMKDAKGLHDLAKLLARPGREIAALDLATEGATPGTAARGDDLHAQGDAGEILDDQARRAYKRRLGDLEGEIEEAEAFGDSVRAERARTEHDALAHELASAYGLGGRPRRAGDPAERARTTVTRRIREAMTRIQEAHPALGRHLRKSVRTGSFCVYDPEDATTWDR